MALSHGRHRRGGAGSFRGGAAPPRRPSRVAVAAIAGAGILVIGVFVGVRRIARRRSRRRADPVRVVMSGGINVEPALSPDGSAVAFAPDRSGSFEIYVVGLAGGARR